MVMDPLQDEIERAAARLKARNGAPPWNDHPNALHRALYEANELSTRTRKQFLDHLACCDACTRLHIYAKAPAQKSL